MDDGFFHRVFTQLELSISWLNSLLKAVGLGLLVAVAVVNFDAIASGFRGLVEKLPGLVKVSAFGVTIETNPADIEKTVKIRQWIHPISAGELGEATIKECRRGAEES